MTWKDGQYGWKEIRKDIHMIKQAVKSHETIYIIKLPQDKESEFLNTLTKLNSV